jgi:glucoamylase
VDREGWYSFDQQIIADPSAPVVRIRTVFRPARAGLQVHALFKPAHQNTGTDDIAWAGANALYSEAGPSTVTPPFPVRKFDPAGAAIVASTGFVKTSAGYVGASDGWQDLQKHFQLTTTYAQAGPGNVALIGELRLPELQLRSPEPLLPIVFEFAIGFGPNAAAAGKTAQESLARASFETVQASYERGWTAWLNSLEPTGRSMLARHEVSRLSALVIKMHEDKTRRGAIIASLSKPGVPESDRAGDSMGGYHLVWPRDLYHAATGLLAAGDLTTPRQVLDFLASVQRPDGSWSQNFWVDGSPYWSGLQLDEVAFPILLVQQLVQHGALDSRILSPKLRHMVLQAAAFLAKNGPRSPQDRWEEIGGYIPSTLAAQIAGLRAASRLIPDRPEFAQTAAQWDAGLESWTLVRSSPIGRNYYLRSSPGGKPNEREDLDLANGAGRATASSILDGGFLELVRLAVRDAVDPRIQSTLQMYEDSKLLDISSDTDPATGARGYRRYNRDFYGDSKVGGYWPLLAGERGHAAMAEGDFARARAQLLLLESQTLPSGMIPEQTRTISSPADAGLGVACPLVWAHAEALRLRRSLRDGAVFDMPR